MTPALKKLQGAWNVIELEIEGRAMPCAGAQVVVKDDCFTTTGMGDTYKGQLVVKGSYLDMKFTAGPERGNVNRGIFKVAGEKWRLCLQMTGKDRPKKFATTPGTGLALETLERAKPADKGKRKAAPLPIGDSAPEIEGEWQMVSCVTGGQPLDPQYLQYGKRVAKDNQVTVTMMGRVMLQAKYAVDKSKSPHAMDYVLKDGRPQRGIFRLSGDALTVNFSPPGKDRPADFTSSSGDARTLTVWQRL